MKYSRLRSYSLHDSMYLMIWKRQNTRGWRWEYWIYYKGTREHYRGKWTVLYLDDGGGYGLHDSYEWPENYEWQPSVSSEADASHLRVLLNLSLSNTIIAPSGDEMTKTQYGQNLDCWDHVEKKSGDRLDWNCPCKMSEWEISLVVRPWVCCPHHSLFIMLPLGICLSRVTTNLPVLRGHVYLSC